MSGLRRLLLASSALMATAMMALPASAADIFVTDAASLSAAITSAGAGDTIILQNDINLGTTLLPPITTSVTIDGGGHTIDAQGNSRIFFVDSSATIQNITLENGTAKGGNGGAGFGGGGMGAGGAIFVNSGTTTVSNVSFASNTATGGNGGGGASGSGTPGGGGGGGLGGSGGGAGQDAGGGGGGYSGGGGGAGGSTDGSFTTYTGSGGNGPGGNGGNGGPGAPGQNGANGGTGGSANSEDFGTIWTMGGGGGGGGINGGNGGNGSTDNVNGGGGGGGGGLASGNGGNGGSQPGSSNGTDGTLGGGAGADGFAGNGGEFGGGGGGVNFGNAGNGGYGGGGGGSGFAGTNGGNGGFGGGGGGMWDGTAGTGGVGGGNGGFVVAGGGAGFGGSIFVREGASINITDGTFGGSSATGGSGSDGVANGAAAGSDLFLSGGGTTTFNPTGTLTFNGSIGDDSATSVAAGQGFTAGTGAGASIAIAGGTVVFNGANTYGGTTTVTNASVVAGNDSAFSIGAVSLENSTLRAGASVTLGNAITLNGDNTFDSSTQTLTISGVIADGTGTGMTKSGTGTLALSGANTYSGQTTLSQGTISLLNDQALGSSILYSQGGTVDFGNGTTIGNLIILDAATQFNVDAGATATQANQVLETGTPQSLEKTGGGTLIVNSLNNSGVTTITAGTWQAGALNAWSANSAYTVATGATLDMGGFSQTVSSLSGAGTVTSSVAGNVIFSVGNFATGNIGTEFSGSIQDGAGNVGLTVDGMTGTGPFILSGTNTYTGDTLICDCSSLQIGNGGTSGSITSNVINNNLLIFNRSDTYNFSNTISDGLGHAGRVEQNGTGTLVLSGVNTYSDGTTINSGAVQVTNNNSVGTGTVTLNGGAFVAGTTGLNFINAFAVNSAGGTIDTNANTLTLSGGINDGTSPGEINAVGQGTLALSGTGNFTGQLTVSDNTTLRFESNNAIGTGIVQVQGSTIDYAAGVNIANSINLGSATTAFNVSSGTATQSGVIEDISSASVFEKTGAGTLIVTSLGVEGATVVTAGTLTGGGLNAFSPTSAMTVASGGILNIGGFGQTVASLAGDGTVTNNGVSAATLRLNTAGIETFAGTMSDGASALGLTMNGTGTTILTGINTYTGATTVNDGILQIDGSLTSSATTVNSGATLSGSGSVFNTTINSGGMLMPGDGSAPATLSVTGNLTFNSGSTYVVFMTPTVNSLTTVSGTATLNGTVNVTATPGVYNVGQQYNIITATGGFNGTTFTDLTTTGFGTDVPTLAYDTDDVFLLFSQKTIVLLPSFNGNQGQVATGINNAMLGGATPGASFTTLFGLPQEQLAGGLSQLAGQGATGGAFGGIKMMNSFLSLLLNPQGGAPNGNPGALGFARAFGPGEQISPQAAEAYAAVTPKDRRLQTFDQRWSFWGQGYGGYSTNGGDPVAGTNDVATRTWGLASGADYRVSPSTTLGFSIAGGTMSWNLADGLGGGKSDVFQIGAYGSRSFGAGYVSAAASYAWHDMTTDRTVTTVGTEQMRADFQGHNYGGRIETGFRLITSWLGITPYAAAQVQQFYTPGYSEVTVAGTGAFALSYDSRSVTATRLELGSWFEKIFALDRGSALAIRARAAWAHDHSSDNSLTAVFQSLPGSTFVVNGAAAPSDLLLLSAGAELRLANNWTVAAKFDGEFAASAQTYTGTGSVRYAW